MKKTLLLLASAALLFAGCTKEQIAGTQATDEGIQNVTFTVGVESAATKAVADGDGAAAKINHWVMQVLDSDNALYNKQEKNGTTGLTQTFEVPLVKGQTYKVLFWADHITYVEDGDNKKHYNTDDLTNVQLINATTYDANLDERDAFSAKVTDFSTTVATQQQITLKRPFAQLNVVFTDLNNLYTTMGNDTEYGKFKPVTFVAKAKVPTTFDVLNQTAGAPAETALEMTAAECYNPTGVAGSDNYTTHGEKATLYMDYIFATAGSKDIVDIDFSFVSKGVTIAHNFAAVPFQRNYRTNILGNLMSANAKWEVTVSPTWDSLDDGSKDYNVNYYEPSSITDAQEYIENNDDQKSKVVDLSKYTVTANDYINAEDKKIEFKLKTTSPEDMVNFTLPEIPEEFITAGCEGWKITHESGYPTQNVNVTAPQGTLVTIDAPRSHVTLNGELYEQVTATTSQSTLVVPAGVTVDKLIVKEGAVEIHGVVNNLTVSPETGKTVVFKDCENLKPAVYAIAKQKIAEGYVADDATNSIVKKDFVQDENGVWHVMNAKAYNEFAAAVNSGVTFEGKTVVLDEDIDFQNATVAPIGNYTDNTPFKGTFNGNNKKLSNLTVQNIVGKQGVGVFGKVYAPCVIKNLVVEGATVIGDKETAGDKAIAYVGGIAGHGYATIQNCTFKGDIYAGHQIGGIAGSGGFTITGCTFEGNIISERYWALAGIIGNCQDGGAISGNTAKGTISAKGSDPLIAGGIIGAPLYTTYDVKDNYAAMSMSYNGEPFENVYPIVGVYNEDQPKTETDFAKLTSTLANNTWDKTISPEDSYPILYHSDNLTPTGYFINYGAATAKASVAKIGETKYTSLAEAVAAAQEGQTVEIVMAGEYTVPGISENIIVKGSVEGVIFNCVGSGSIASIPNGCTFENVSFKMGSGNYHGFQHAGTLNMKGCTFEGLFFSYGDMNFTGCTFNQTASDYCMWDYGQDLTYTNCTFNCAGKFINVYNEGNGNWKLTVEGCTFNSTSKNKAALNIKASCGATNLGWKVSIKNCSVNDESMFPAASGDAESVLFVGSALWQVDDRTSSSLEANIVSVKVDDVLVYGPEF